MFPTIWVLFPQLEADRSIYYFDTMALAMTPVAPVRDDMMDIDIQMDVDDFGPMVEEDDMLEVLPRQILT